MKQTKTPTYTHTFKGKKKLKRHKKSPNKHERNMKPYIGQGK